MANPVRIFGLQKKKNGVRKKYKNKSVSDEFHYAVQ